jgi:hypothetical protein
MKQSLGQHEEYDEKEPSKADKMTRMEQRPRAEISAVS